VVSVFIVRAICLRVLGVSSTHADVSSNANPAALLSDNTTEVGALRKSGEFLRAIDGEWSGSHEDAAVNMLAGDVGGIIASVF